VNKIKRFIYGFICRNQSKKEIYIAFNKRISLHFLFNSLNAVASLCRKNPEAAYDLVIEISTYLQRSLEEKAVLIPLQEELEHVFSYINIQSARFSDRLKIVTDIEEGIQCMIPSSILQPIVDNSIRHGILKRKQGGTVSISIKKEAKSVQIVVKDDGIGMTMKQIDTLFKRYNKHHSLYKANRILKMSGFSGLGIESIKNGGTVITFTIPAITDLAKA
jgi:LytS/YehU family sensor histidine kinase